MNRSLTYRIPRLSEPGAANDGKHQKDKSGLSEIGLPEGHNPLALLFFSVGVEAGHFLFIGAVAAGRGIKLPVAQWVQPALPYAIGHVAVFVPGAPSPWSGSVYFMTEDRIKPLDASIKTAMGCVKRLGMGSNALLHGKL